MARLIEGTFDIPDQSTFVQTQGTPLDSDLFSRLGLVLIQGKLEKLKPSEIAEKVAPISPTLAARLSAVADDPQAFATILAAIIAFIGAIVTAMIVTGGSEPTEEHIHIEIERRLESDLEQTRDHLYEFRQAGYRPPDWSTDYL